MDTPAPDYEELSYVLDAADLEMSAAEAHGIVTGASCVPRAPDLGRLFFGNEGVPPTDEAERLLATLAALKAEIDRRLAETDFDFEPLLPRSPQDPSEVEALGAWARGFVLGLAAVGVRHPDELPGDASEFLFDTMQIGEVQLDAAPDAEQQERDIAEIVEYLRVGVQLIYEALHARQGPTDTD
jgi:yecA family protein